MKSRYHSDHCSNGSEDEGASWEDDSGSENVGEAKVVNWISISILVGVFGSGCCFLISQSWCYSSTITIFDKIVSGWPVAFLARLGFGNILGLNATETLSTFTFCGVINVCLEPIVLLWITGICFWCFTSHELCKRLSLQSNICWEIPSSAYWPLGTILSSSRLKWGSKQSDVWNISHNFKF